MPSTSDLRELLSSDAARASRGSVPVEEVIQQGRRLRRRRRIVGVSGACVVAAAAVALPFALSNSVGVVEQPRSERTLAAADSAPVVPPDGGWVEDLPGVDLPVGDPLTTAYASGSTLVAEGRTLELGAQIRQVIDVPEGVVILTEDPDAGVRAARLEIVGDDGSAVLIDSAGVIARVRALVDPTGATPTRLAWLWLKSDRSLAGEIRSVALDGADPMSSVSGQFNDVLGFRDGAVLVSTISDSRAVPDLARWEPGSDAVEEVAPAPSGGAFILGLTGSDDDRALMYTGEVPQCNYAAPATDLGDKLWEQCEGGPLVAAPAGDLAANIAGVVDVATGQFVTKFDLGTPNLLRWDQGPDTEGVAAYVAGWSGDDVLIKLSTSAGVTTTPAPGGAVTYDPAYVGVRCSTSTGACSRLPHAIDAVDGSM